MGRLLKYLLRLILLGIVALIGYALLADLPPPVEDVEIELPIAPASQ